MVKLSHLETNPPKLERSYANMIPQKQLPLADVYKNCKHIFKEISLNICQLQKNTFL